jgi:hypothetical protein
VVQPPHTICFNTIRCVASIQAKHAIITPDLVKLWKNANGAKKSFWVTTSITKVRQRRCAPRCFDYTDTGLCPESFAVLVGSSNVPPFVIYDRWSTLMEKYYVMYGVVFQASVHADGLSLFLVRPKLDEDIICPYDGIIINNEQRAVCKSNRVWRLQEEPDVFLVGTYRSPGTMVNAADWDGNSNAIHNCTLTQDTTLPHSDSGLLKVIAYGASLSTASLSNPIELMTMYNDGSWIDKECGLFSICPCGPCKQARGGVRAYTLT